MKPSALSLKGLIKIHKPDQSIRPAVHLKNAPTYQISKLFTSKINQLCPLPHAFNVGNTHDLRENLHNTPPITHYTLASLDIKNLYPSIPVAETNSILTNILKTQAHRTTDPNTDPQLL
jgi:hypothetical protein